MALRACTVHLKRALPEGETGETHVARLPKRIPFSQLVLFGLKADGVLGGAVSAAHYITTLVDSIECGRTARGVNRRPRRVLRKVRHFEPMVYARSVGIGSYYTPGFADPLGNSAVASRARKIDEVEFPA